MADSQLAPGYQVGIPMMSDGDSIPIGDSVPGDGEHTVRMSLGRSANSQCSWPDVRQRRHESVETGRERISANPCRMARVTCLPRLRGGFLFNRPFPPVHFSHEIHPQPVYQTPTADASSRNVRSGRRGCDRGMTDTRAATGRAHQAPPIHGDGTMALRA